MLSKLIKSTIFSLVVCKTGIITVLKASDSWEGSPRSQLCEVQQNSQNVVNVRKGVPHYDLFYVFKKPVIYQKYKSFNHSHIKQEVARAMNVL